MTFNPQDCPQCRNTGTLNVPKISGPTKIDDAGREPRESIYEIEEKYCTCWFGKERERIDIKIAQPGYRHPQSILQKARTSDFLRYE